jgi:hypothetical protein
MAVTSAQSSRFDAGFVSEQIRHSRGWSRNDPKNSSYLSGESLIHHKSCHPECRMGFRPTHMHEKQHFDLSHPCHPERSVAKSKDLRFLGFSTHPKGDNFDAIKHAPSLQSSTVSTVQLPESERSVRKPKTKAGFVRAYNEQWLVVP